MIVLKFGGTSVGKAESLANVKKIVENLNQPAVVVVSALGGITDKLIATARMAAHGNPDYLDEMDAIARRHQDIVARVIEPAKALRTLAKIDPLLQELKRLYDGVSLIADLPDRTLDHIVSIGERLSSVIVADMIPGASHHNSLDFIKTEKWFDKNIASVELTSSLIRQEFDDNTPYPAVTGGFISSDKLSGEITNLGRGGSDYTAALIAAALDADILQIWTDVDGFLTSDPRIIPQASVIPQMSFVESMDLCSFGAKVIYPPTIYPVFHKNIPIRILNTFRPEVSGTYIADSNSLDQSERNDVTGLSSLPDTSVMTLRGRNLELQQGLASRAVNALARKGISILLTLRALDNCSSSFAISSKDADNAIRLLKEEFAPELVDRTVEVIEKIDGLASVAVVGDGIPNIPEASSNILRLLGNNDIDVVAFSDQASKTTLSFVILEKDVKSALKLLHAFFFE